MATDNGSPVVLIVEDEDSLREMYKTRLGIDSDVDYTVKTADGGVSASEKLSKDIDIVLLDRRMPDMSGDEVADEINDRGLDVGVAMVTAVEPDYDIVDMPFDTYIVKPISHEELTNTVDELLSRQTYEGKMQDLFTLMSKKAALEAEKASSELRDSDEFQQIVERIEQLQDDISDDMDELSDHVDYSGYHDEFTA